MQKRIAEKSLGTVTVMNTDHGRLAYVERVAAAWGGSALWTVAVVCNGIADYSETFKTKREAMATFESLT